MKIIIKFFDTLKHQGWKAATHKLFNYFKSFFKQSEQKKDVISGLEFILASELDYFPKKITANITKNSMTWLIPDFNAYSGGHINILRMINLLKTLGFPNQHIVVMEPYRWTSDIEAKTNLKQFYGNCGITLSLGVHSIRPCEYLIATSWSTAYWVAKYPNTQHRLYFVQDYEPAFFPCGSDYFMAENTYKLGLIGLTAGTWLAEKLKQEYGMKTFPYSFGCDLDLYKPYPKIENRTIKQIFFYARPITIRRCFEIGLFSLKKIYESHPNIKVVFAGGDISNYEIPFPHVNLGSVPINELPRLYSQSDVALILSATNLSLLPLEVAACGCPMVINRGKSSEWLLSDKEAFYCDLSIEGIVSALTYVLNNPEEAQFRSSNAMKRAQKSSWAKEASHIANFLNSL